MTTRNEEAAQTAQAPAAEVDEALLEEITDALKDVIDPELGVNIVDLGLVYDVRVDQGHVEVVMTLTTPACPLSAYFKQVIPAAVGKRVPEIGSVSVRVVWEPRWTPEMMSQEAKKALGWTR